MAGSLWGRWWRRLWVGGLCTGRIDSASYIYLYNQPGKKSMARSKPTHITRGNVLDDLGFSPEQAAVLKFKADLYKAILKHARRYSPKQLQAILAEPQPRVSELLNGKIANKSVDKLLC